MTQDNHAHPAPTPRELIVLDAVHVWYQKDMPGATHALRGVSLQVRAGDRVALLGAAGSGKSTLLHVISRLQESHTGHVRLGAATSTHPDPGADPDTAPDTVPDTAPEVVAPRTHARDVLPSFVFQFPERQLFAETVFNDVAYGLRESGIDKVTVKQRVEQALDDVGLPVEQFAQRSPFALSSGERRRVALAGALAQRRGIVLFDEPTLGLDREGAWRLRQILQRLHDRGAAYWVASHDTDFVASCCERVVALDAGRLAYDGTVEDFWRLPERAASLGVAVPRAASLARALEDLAVRNLPTLPDEAALVAALTAAQTT